MLTLEVVTPDGVALREPDVEVVVLRRRERTHDIGSEVAILPQHGPLLVRIPVAPARYGKGRETVHLALSGGFAEVRDDRVTVLTPRCVRQTDTARDPESAAADLCVRWRAEAAGSREEIAGVPA
jgi:F-type H+-transporting ATPase subunit epsilon